MLTHRTDRRCDQRPHDESGNYRISSRNTENSSLNSSSQESACKCFTDVICSEGEKTFRLFGRLKSLDGGQPQARPGVPKHKLCLVAFQNGRSQEENSKGQIGGFLARQLVQLAPTVPFPPPASPT